MFSSTWNSLDSVSRLVNWTQLSLVLFGAVTIALTAAQYKLGLRKDFLSGNTQKQKELALNERITQASTDAANSMKELQIAKTSLAQTQNAFDKAAKDASESANRLSLAQEQLRNTELSLATATAEANSHLRDYLAAKEQVNKLERRSQKIITLQLRVEVLVAMSPRKIASMNTNFRNEYTILSDPASPSKDIAFRSEYVKELPIDEKTVRYVSVFDPDDPMAVSGMNISDLDGRTNIVTNFVQFLSSKLQEGGIVAQPMKWAIIVNGAIFPLSTDQLLPESLYTAKVISVFIPDNNRSISTAYNLLLR